MSSLRKAINNMIDLRRTTRMNDHLKALVDDLYERVNGLKLFDRDSKINCYCDELEGQVISTIESAIQRLNEVQEKLLTEIKAYRDGLLSRLVDFVEPTGDAHKSLNEEMEQLSGELRTFEEKLAAHYAACSVDLETVEMARAVSNELKARAKGLKRRMRHSAFEGRFMRFSHNKLLLLDSDSVGKLDLSDEDLEYPNEITPVLLEETKATKIFTVEVMWAGIFLQDGKFAFSDSSERVTICDPKTGNALYTLHSFKDTFCALAQLPSSHLLVGNNSGCISMWDLESKTKVKSWTLAHASVYGIVVMPDGSVATQLSDNTIQIWRLNTNKDRTVLRTLRGHGMVSHMMSTLLLLSNGFLATCSQDNKATLRVWNPASGKILKELHHDFGTITRIRVLPNDDIVMYFADGIVRVVDLSNEDASRTFYVKDGDQVELIQLPSGRLYSIHSSGPSLLPWTPASPKRPNRTLFNRPWYLSQMDVDKKRIMLIARKSFGPRTLWLLDLETI